MAKKSQFQIALEYHLARALFSFLKYLPRDMAILSGLFVARVGYLCLGRLRRTGMRNAQLAFPEATAKEHQRLVLGCFRSLGRQLAEVSQFPKATKESIA